MIDSILIFGAPAQRFDAWELRPDGNLRRPDFMPPLVAFYDCAVPVVRAYRSAHGRYRLELSRHTPPLPGTMAGVCAESDRPIALTAAAVRRLRLLWDVLIGECLQADGSFAAASMENVAKHAGCFISRGVLDSFDDGDASGPGWHRTIRLGTNEALDGLDRGWERRFDNVYVTTDPARVYGNQPWFDAAEPDIAL